MRVSSPEGGALSVSPESTVRTSAEGCGFVAKFWEEVTQAKYKSVKLSVNVG
jgi:hypothetical protein